MATSSDNKEYFLVSDSNEINSQLDSKKMDWDELRNLAENNLFKKHLGILDNYLTVSQYDIYKKMLVDTKTSLDTLWNMLKDQNWSGKFKPAHGQIIVIYKDDVPTGMAPIDYLRAHWDIPLDATINQWKDCMIRGITYTEDHDDNPIKRDSNQIVKLKEINVPPHMHHSEITSGSTIESMSRVKSGTDSKRQELSERYDMFYNDSLDTGLDKNELDGSGDSFEVEYAGSNETLNGQPALPHNNMPVMHNCYVFEILIEK